MRRIVPEEGLNIIEGVQGLQEFLDRRILELACIVIAAEQEVLAGWVRGWAGVQNTYRELVLRVERGSDRGIDLSGRDW